MLRKRKKNPRTSRYKESLYHLAIKFDSFEDFWNYYSNGLALGIYWVGTDEEERDFISPIEREYAKEGKLIAYISPEYIKEKYAAEISVDNMDPYEDIRENRTEYTNSIKILRPDLIYVHYVYTVPKAIEVYKYNTRYLPKTKFEVKQFWDYAQARKELEEEGSQRKTKRKRKLKK